MDQIYIVMKDEDELLTLFSILLQVLTYCYSYLYVTIYDYIQLSLLHVSTALALQCHNLHIYSCLLPKACCFH